MELTQLTKEELTLIAAVVAAIGASIAATISLFSTSRSKYIDAITLTRIAWVRELRTEFSNLMSTFDKLYMADYHKLDGSAKYELEVKILDAMMLLNLKLNKRSSLDQEIFVLMGNLLRSVQTSNESEYGFTLERLATVVEELLKEEWETAKLEASGPIRQIRIRWNRSRRKKARQQRQEKWLAADHTRNRDGH